VSMSNNHSSGGLLGIDQLRTDGVPAAEGKQLPPKALTGGWFSQSGGAVRRFTHNRNFNTLSW
jgi:hypothetical protein